ncbi:uncharacterized protein LOC113291932 [Papaver somniferum]|uniref:uncharacterized protein LOC113291932 n=1 Tax=Papaver somniferum TaxID=3469 RepID=UPI000E6FD33C|nr:uncharacterized protein LOC113291932 [Papaver somniferum]
MKDAYDYYMPRVTGNLDFRDLWSIKVPLRRAYIAWKIMHNRIATDDNVKTQGVDAANCCNLCPSSCCKKLNLIYSLTVYLLTLFGDGLCRFEHCLISSNQAITHLKNLIVESSRHSGGFSFNTSVDKIILDFLGIKSLPPKMPKAISVKWKSRIPGWIKANIDGCSIGNPGPSGCGMVFRDSHGLDKGCLAQNLGFNNSSWAELYGAIYALRLACAKRIQRLWLECDSIFVLQAIKNPDLVTWTLSTHWSNCLKFASSIKFVCTHIYREGNSVVGLLAKHGALVKSRWWIEPPNFTRRKLLIDNSILPLYRFRNM